MEPFPLMGVDGMHNCLQGEVCWFTLLTHNISDSFSQARIVPMLENIVAPACLDG